jgi:hypothetical protein
MTGLKKFAIFVAVIVGGFFVVKFADAYIDVNGIESDLRGFGSDLMIECIADPYCEDDLIEQIEMIRAHNNRDVVLDYDSLDYAASANVVLLSGTKEIDLLFKKHTYKFNLEVAVWR